MRFSRSFILALSMLATTACMQDLPVNNAPSGQGPGTQTPQTPTVPPQTPGQVPPQTPPQVPPVSPFPNAIPLACGRQFDQENQNSALGQPSPYLNNQSCGAFGPALYYSFTSPTPRAVEIRIDNSRNVMAFVLDEIAIANTGVGAGCLAYGGDPVNQNAEFIAQPNVKYIIAAAAPAPGDVDTNFDVEVRCN